MQRIKFLSLLGILFLSLIPLKELGASELLPIPTLSSPVVDQVGVLEPSQKQRLEELSYALRDQDQVYLQVLVIKNLGDETIEQFSIRVTDQWKLGEKKTDRGELLVVAIENKKIRIEVGRGLEGILTDLVTKRILREEATPFFRRGDFGGGILAAQVRVAAIIRKGLHAETSYSEKSSEGNVSGKSISVDEKDSNANKNHDLILFIILICLILFFNRFGGGGGRRGLRPWGGGWYGGGGWSGGGGSSWSGGGGGGFGGGGASGDW